MASSSLSSGWTVVLKPVVSPRARLLCFPHGGGSAEAYYAWSAALPGDIEVCALQIPGRGRRVLEAPVIGIERIVGPLWEAFQPFRDAPVAFFGHSLGALVAFEFARRLQAHELSPVHLFASGAAAPHLPDRDPPIHHLPDHEFIAEVRRRYAAMPEEILRSDELMEIVLPALRADFTIAETYRCADGPPLECPITAFGGDRDSSVAFYELAAWRSRTSGAFGMRMFPGGHFFIDSARDALIRHVTEELERSLRGTVFASSAPGLRSAGMP
jgi:medium-chain acyl-[acyl-carrier-protein] hydrolase